MKFTYSASSNKALSWFGNSRTLSLLSLFAIFLSLILFPNSDAQTTEKPLKFDFDGFNNTEPGDKNAVKVCLGTTLKLTKHADEWAHLQQLRARYTNCTYVDGNLEVTWLSNPDVDLSFLNQIEEVTGYVLIAVVHARQIVLPRLRIVRGLRTYNVSGTADPNSFIIMQTSVKGLPGASVVAFPRLQEISRAGVFLSGNEQWCYSQKVYWRDILNDETKQALSINNSYDEKQCPKNEVKCHSSCEAYPEDRGGGPYCWGPEADQCQTLTRISCTKQCGKQRCFGPGNEHCCHTECAAGCSGQTVDTCHACKSKFDGKTCVSQCAPPRRYNPTTYKFEPTEWFQYVFGTLCVNKCPSSMYIDLSDHAYCVFECPEGRQAKGDMRCEPCLNGVCDKTCPSSKDIPINTNITETFKGCTKINGDVVITEQSFEGDPTPKHFHLGMDPKELKVFKDVRLVTGYIYVFAKHPNFTSLSEYFGNLETILGQNLYNGYAVTVVRSSLKELSLRSLKPNGVRSGKVLIKQNPDLCYANNINWTSVVPACTEAMCNGKVSGNMDPTACQTTGAVCSPECVADQGCWGPSPEDCLACTNFLLNNTGECVSSCDESKGFFVAAPGICQVCDANCKGSCSGPGSEHCDECLDVKDGFYCKVECPKEKYPDAKNVCQSCHEACSKGPCTGPLATLGEGGCSECARVVETRKPDAFRLTPGVYVCTANDTCPPNHHESLGKRLLTNNPFREAILESALCQACHPECDECSGYGNQKCLACRNFWLPVVGVYETYDCLSKCHKDYFVNATRVTETVERRVCQKCDPQCDAVFGCSGPGPRLCNKCRNKAVPYDNNGHQEWECVGECPEDMKFSTKDKCYAEDPSAAEIKQKQTGMISGIVVGVVVLIVVIVITILCLRRARTKHRTMLLSARMSGLQETVPLTPTDAPPDLSRLRVIRESELKRGPIIGSGAFGTVYRGVWIPDGENVKMPVAIKVLHESSPVHAQELLDEARIMCSVDHTCCVRIMAVCLGSQMMLVSQLMPEGCLLEYVRRNKANIGSKAILNWCTQIARGMGHLEELGIVHRDLAARNVLVQSPHLVKITDFGLAKLLDIDEEAFQATGGKMPIKWLALECITHRVFTHKSDVWSYGVTVWELCTYGQRPYENMRAVEVPDLLEKGERLGQPGICTIDVYMMLIKCWMKDPDSRPSFTDLVEEFAKMARDPARYLVVKGDALMRLPSIMPNAHDIMIPELSDAPGQVVLPDDYLRPAPSPPASGASGSEWSDSGFNSLAKSPQHSVSPTGFVDERATRDKKYGHLENRARDKRNRVTSDGHNRYSQDPLESRREGGALQGAAAEAAIPFFDEDGYLEPVAKPELGYVEAVGDGGPDARGSSSHSPTYDEPKPQPQVAVVSPIHLDNPEYFSTGPDGVEPSETDPLNPEKEMNGNLHDYCNTPMRVSLSNLPSPATETSI